LRRWHRWRGGGQSQARVTRREKTEISQGGLKTDT